MVRNRIIKGFMIRGSTGMSHGWQGGSIAVYGGQSLYKVGAVTAASGPRRANDEGRHNGRGGTDRNGSEEGKRSGFAEMLMNAAGRPEESGNVRVRTTGYTRKGVPSEFYIKMRDYTYQR